MNPPAFLGWRMLAWCTLAMGLTAPGQTIGVAVFIDHFVTDLSLSRSQVSAAYLVGTVLGALSMPAAGRLIDKHGVRWTMAAVGLGFGAALIATGAVQGLVTLAIAFVGIRMLGQGALGLVGQTGVTLWFERRRGFAMAVAITASSGLMALAPLAFTFLIAGVGWRAAWVVIGVAVWATVLPIALFAIVNRPEDVGQLPDGDPLPPPDATAPAGRDDWTAAEAVRTPAFWSVNLISILTAAFVTGATFHHVAIMGDRGLSETQAAAVFVPQVAGAIIAGFAFGWMGDKVPARVLVPVTGGLLATGLALASVVTPGPLALLYGLLLGINMGAIRSVAAVALPRWFGVAHIGAIRGIETGIAVAASATGPLVVALGSQWLGGYGPILMICAFVAAAAALTTLAIPDPPRSPPVLAQASGPHLR